MNIEKFISMKWFSERKPYSVPYHSEYELFYLNLTRQVFKQIKNFFEQYKIRPRPWRYSDEEIREFAYMISGYAEDVFNGIGIFDALRQYFKTRFGSPLPIIHPLSSDYDTEDINREDILFLSWCFYIVCHSDEDHKPMLNPSSPAMLKLSEEIFDELDCIREFSSNDFYDDYFSISENEGYIPVKNKIMWFTLNNYLTGFETTKRHVKDIQEYMDKNPSKNKNDVKFFSHYDYTLQDIYAFETPLSLGALTPSQLFANIARCSDRMKKQIENLVVRHYGIFHLQSEDSHYYYLHHTGVKKDYRVLKQSFNHPLAEDENDMWLMNLIEWNGVYELTGACFPCVYQPDEIRIENLKMQNKFYRFDEDFRKTLNDIASEFSHSAQQFFGKQLIAYQSGEKLEQDINNFLQWHQQQMQKKHGAEQESSEEIKSPPKFNLELEKKGDFAVFIPENNNTEIIQGHQFLINIINTPSDKWSPRDRQEAAMMIVTNDISADYIKFLYKQYPHGHWERALYLPIADEGALDFILHFYKPDDFRFRKAPRFTTIDSSVLTEKDKIKMKEGLWVKA